MAVVCSLLLAGALSSGILAMMPVFEHIVTPGGGRTLGQLAERLNRASTKAVGFAPVPDALIARLPTSPYAAVLWIMVGLGAVVIVGGVLNVAHAWLSQGLVQDVVRSVRDDAFASVIHQPLAEVVRDGATERASRIVNDASALEAGLNAMLSRALPQASKGIGAVAAAFIAEWKLSLPAIVLGPILYTVLRKLGKRIRRASRSALAEQATLFSQATESLQGLRTVKAYTAEPREIARFAHTNAQVTRHVLKARLAKSMTSPIVEMLTLLVLGAMFVVVAKAIIDRQIEPQGALVAMAALFAAGASFKPLSSLVNDIQTSSAAAVRLRELLASPAEPRIPASGPHETVRLDRELRFEHVGVRYPQRELPALDDVSLTILAGQTVAFVGANGSGKTTLLSLIPRLIEPTAGRVLIDGLDLAHAHPASLRRGIAVVTQETVLFRGSIRDNIALGRAGMEQPTDEAIQQAARSARADEFIQQLPSGYGTAVGEQGLTLSGGQRQRIAIARAMLRDPALLILDEATSMIDAHSEALIAQAIADFGRGRTCLIIAHRLSTVRSADRIVVMDAGRVVDDGTHAQLLARCPLYRRLAEHQLEAVG